MLGGNYQVLLACFRSQSDPVARVEADRIEPRRQCGILLDRDFLAAHHPLSTVCLVTIYSRKLGVDPPVDEHSEFGILEPFHPAGPLGGDVQGK